MPARVFALPLAVLPCAFVAAVASLLPWSAAVAGPEPGTTPSLAQPELDRLGRQIVMTRCKRPLSVKRERVPSPRSPQVLDVVWTTACPGFEVVTFRAAGGRERPMMLTMSAPHPDVAADLAVGTRPQAVQARLSPPWSTQGSDLVYALHPERPNDDTLTFRVAQGRVVELVWSWETD